jgi:hypothetical protein
MHDLRRCASRVFQVCQFIRWDITVSYHAWFIIPRNKIWLSIIDVSKYPSPPKTKFGYISMMAYLLSVEVHVDTA